MDEAVVIDVRGLKCPLPVLKAAKRMSRHPPGTAFTIIATDPLAAIDIPHFCNEQGHALIATRSTDGEFRFEVRKGEARQR